MSRTSCARAAQADLRLLVLDASGDWKAAMRTLTAETENWDPARDIVVLNKVDLAPADPAAETVPLSVRSGEGLPELLARLESAAGTLMDEGARDQGGAPPLTRARHREALAEAHASLGRALVAPEIALAAEDLRLALRAIGRITGTVRVEELLDVIFRDFCIGK